MLLVDVCSTPGCTYMLMLRGLCVQLVDVYRRIVLRRRVLRGQCVQHVEYAWLYIGVC